MYMKFLPIWLAVCLTSGIACVEPAFDMVDFPEPESVFNTLRPEHPRLVFTPEKTKRISALLKRDAMARRIYAGVKADALEMLKAPPRKYEKPDGRRLLRISRAVLSRVRALSLVYLLEGGRQYKERIWKEMEAVVNFPDWNPAHFLDTAEMTHAVALAYDSLFDEWTEEQRRILREAIVKLGIKPALKRYAKKFGWHLGENNWNQVCNGGIGLGCLAVAGETESQLPAKALCKGIRSLPLAMHYYAPDGGGTEGVTYWSYGTRYNIILLDALQNALDTDFGLAKIPGFKESGSYHLYISGAKRCSFNFGDCGLVTTSTPQHFWMGKVFNEPAYSWFRYSTLAGNIDQGTLLDLLWWDDEARDFDVTALPRDKYFRKAEVASMRSAWGDPEALVLAIQAGKNDWNKHRHLDLGSFIIESQGERWFIDSGREPETYQRHRNKHARYDFYRTRAEGHNTLVFNPDEYRDQAIDAVVPITLFESGDKTSKAVLDLGSAYKRHAVSVTRTFTMTAGETVTIRDDIRSDKANDLWWFAHTEAKIITLGKVAILEMNGKRLYLEILQPVNTPFKTCLAAPFPSSPNPEKQASNKGRSKLAIHLENAKDTVIEVQISRRRP